MSTIKVNTLETAGGANTIDVERVSALNTQFAYRNKLLNAGFKIWQRGTTFETVDNVPMYVADRWQVLVNGGTKTIARVIDPMEGGAKYGIGVSGAALSTSMALQQRMESVDVYDMWNQPVTISVMINTSLAGAITLAINTPTEVDDWTQETNLDNRVIPVSIGMNHLQYTIDNIGDCRNGLNMYIGFNGPFPGGETMSMYEAQIEKGLVKTPLENRPVAVELSMCQRYYEKGSITRSGILTGGTGGMSGDGFKVTKRVTPTMTVTSETSLINCTSVTLTQPSQNIVRHYATTVTVAGNNTRYYVDYTAEAEL